MKKLLVFGLVFLFIGTSIVPSISTAIEDKSCIAPINDGNLSGYVYDTNMEPIEGALVRVEFHSEYEENYTDSNGYYHVSNIPLCFCLKNCSASKVDYVTEWVYLEIIEETFYDFVLSKKGESFLFAVIWGLFSSIELVGGDYIEITSNLKRLKVFGLKFDVHTPIPTPVFVRRCSRIRVSDNLDFGVRGNDIFQFIRGGLLDGYIHWEK